MPVFATANHAEGIGLPDLAAHTYATAAQHARCVVEGVAHLGHATSHCQVLDGPRVGGLRYQQLGNVAPQSEDLFRVGADDHPVLGLEGAGRRDFGSSVPLQFHQTHATTSIWQDAPHVAEVGDADAMIKGRVEDVCALWHPDPGPVYGQGDIFWHASSYLTMMPHLTARFHLTMMASNLHSSLQMPHLAQISPLMTCGSFLSPVMAP
jgi:hypothetical protein